jgi:looped-hinge helix DNA binding domain, AbrB family
MSKTEFKIVDDSGRVTIPKAVREALGLSAGDVVAVTHGRGIIGIKKAVVMADDKMPMPAKEAYVDAVIREMDADALTRVVEAAAKQLTKLNEK